MISLSLRLAGYGFFSLKIGTTMYILILILSTAINAFVPFSGNLIDGPSMKSNSGIIKISYSEQVQKMEEFALDHPAVATVVHYGNSLGNRELTGLLIKRPEPYVTTRLTIITGAIHGNEYLNIADRLAVGLINSNSDELQSYLNRGGSLFIVPVVNPDGYDRSTRGNLSRADLNRDWPGPSINTGKSLNQPETKELAAWIDSYLASNIKLDIALDYHCCAKGMLLLPWGWKKSYMSDEHRARSKVYENMLAIFFKKPGRIGTPPDVLYAASGTTLDYWYDRYKGVSFTYEGRYRKEARMLDQHISWWNKILSTFK
jgi:hypothetical protein